MESLKQWGMTLCFAALSAGLANIVAPRGNLEKVYKFAVSLFFLCCVIVPLFHLKGIQLNTSLGTSSGQLQNSTLEQTVNQQKLDQAKSSVANLVAACCEKNGVTPVGINVAAAADKNGVISIAGATVKVKASDKDKKSKIIAAVKQDLGIGITVEEGEK